MERRRHVGDAYGGDMAGMLFAFESGTMDPSDVNEFVQELIDTGLAWKLQGSYGRLAEGCIAAGLCHA